AASKTMRPPAEGSSRRRFRISASYASDENFPASLPYASTLGSQRQFPEDGVDDATVELLAEPHRKRERSGRSARREQRSHGSQGLGRPYIVRNIPTYDVLGEESLLRIEETADRILSEIGIEFRDDP